MFLILKVEVIQCLLIFLDDTTSISSGIHNWNNHLQITLYNNRVLIVICFPQEYDNTNINIKYNNVRNEGHTT